jgi:hypothetical protein
VESSSSIHDEIFLVVAFSSILSLLCVCLCKVSLSLYQDKSITRMRHMLYKRAIPNEGRELSPLEHKLRWSDPVIPFEFSAKVTRMPVAQEVGGIFD